MSTAKYVLVDISNSFTKVALAGPNRVGKVLRLPTRELTASSLRKLLSGHTARYTVAASVVPARNVAVDKALGRPLWVNSDADLGIGIDYPNPRCIGADRLANAVAARILYGSPSIVVDFGTAVTFDVVSSEGKYAGGVIAPGLASMTDYLHKRTALLPQVELREPRRAIGRSTEEAMRSGAVHGYRGLVGEILRQIQKEIGAKRHISVVATGGDARLIAGKTGLFSAVAPGLTLEGLRLIGERNFGSG